MKNKSFTLLEYKAIYEDTEISEPYKDKNGNLVLPAKAFAAIEKFYYANSQTHAYFAPARKYGKKALVAQNYVGVIQTKDGTTVEILPKITNIEDNESKRVLVKMLKTIKKSPFKHFNMAHLRSNKMPLLEIFITMFLDEVEALIQKGLKSDYITREENLGYLKGKLNIKEQITRNAIHKERFFVAYDEYLSDRVENRLVKTALNYLYKKSASNANKKRIREYLFVFDEIGISHTIKQDFARVTLGRQMRDYERVLLWAKTFLLDSSYTPHKGKDIAFALLFDMNVLFESYVGAYLRRKGFQIALQDSRYHLAYLKGKGRFRLKPDIVIRDKNIIADTKWKILSEDKVHQGVAQADMYQLFAYGTKYRSKSMYLIYPRDAAIRGNRYDYYLPKHSESLKLNVVFFDLMQDRFCRMPWYDTN